MHIDAGDADARHRRGFRAEGAIHAGAEPSGDLWQRDVFGAEDAVAVLEVAHGANAGGWAAARLQRKAVRVAGGRRVPIDFLS